MRTKLAVVLCVFCLLAGCKGSEEPLDSAISLRNRVTDSNGCTFHTAITADYGEKIYIFSMDCTTDREGNLSFSVTEPATIAGISGKVSATEGSITFDDKVLAFQTIAGGRITPVTAPWLFINTLRSGYLKGCAQTEQGIEISFDDSYAEDALHVQINTNGDVPVSAEIFWQGRRVMTLAVERFTYL